MQPEFDDYVVDFNDVHVVLQHSGPEYRVKRLDSNANRSGRIAVTSA